MAIVRSLDEDGDFTFGKGRSNYIESENALRQNVVTRLKQYKNNWEFDKTLGIDYDYFLSTKQSRRSLEDQIRIMILSTPDVRRIIDLSVTVNEREMTLKATISSIYGTFDINFRNLDI